MNKRKDHQLVVLLGPTAVGKTALAVNFAAMLDGEIISADSRQLYKRLDIGSGKDLNEYEHPKGKIPYHLIDILDPTERYDVFRFQRDLYQKYEEIIKRNKLPILCGGTGLYLEAALRTTQFVEVPTNYQLREELDNLSLEVLQDRLRSIKSDLHNSSDLLDRDRLIRAIEIAEYESGHEKESSPIKDHLIFGLRMPREQLRQRIKERLLDRFDQGMLEEVEELLNAGINHEQLDYFGLEYRYLSRYLKGEMERQEMFDKLLQEIRRFAKRQMTWFRRMERQGYVIHWMDANWDLKMKLEFMIEKYER